MHLSFLLLLFLPFLITGSSIDGARSLRSFHGTYLRARNSERDDVRVDMAQRRLSCERWNIEEFDGKVAIKSFCKPGGFLKATATGAVDVSERPIGEAMWTPYKNSDGSWSLKSAHGQWLSARSDGSVKALMLMWPALAIFDLCQTIVISFFLVITIPLASYVYFMLLLSPPFSNNYTFKLIVVNGVAGIISAFIYLFVTQLSTYHFMFNFYKFLERANLGQPLTIINVLFTGLNLNSSLFVALNRVKRIIMGRRNGNDSVFFLFSTVMSILFSLPGVLVYLIFTKQIYVQITLMDEEIMWPRTETLNPIFLTISNILNVLISVITLLVNMVFVLITRNGRLLIRDRRLGTKQFNAEKGLIFTSALSYVFQTLYLINRILAQYFHLDFCAIAQFLFLGIARLSPVWCLIICAPSIRRSLFTFKTRPALTPFHQTVKLTLLNHAPRHRSSALSGEGIGGRGRGK